MHFSKLEFRQDSRWAVSCKEQHWLLSGHQWWGHWVRFDPIAKPVVLLYLDASLFLGESSSEERRPPSLSRLSGSFWVLPRGGHGVYTPLPKIALALSSSLNSLCKIVLCPSVILISGVWLPGAWISHQSQLAGRCQESTIARDSSKLCESTEEKKTGSLLIRNSQTNSGSRIY